MNDEAPIAFIKHLFCDISLSLEGHAYLKKICS